VPYPLEFTDAASRHTTDGRERFARIEDASGKFVVVPLGRAAGSGLLAWCARLMPRFAAVVRALDDLAEPRWSAKRKDDRSTGDPSAW
jgi:hypothetical protein